MTRPKDTETDTLLLRNIGGELLHALKRAQVWLPYVSDPSRPLWALQAAIDVVLLVERTIKQAEQADLLFRAGDNPLSRDYVPPLREEKL